MRILDGEQFLVRIFIGDADKWHHQPLHRALLERLRREGFAGSTVIHGHELGHVLGLAHSCVSGRPAPGSGIGESSLPSCATPASAASASWN